MNNQMSAQEIQTKTMPWNTKLNVMPKPIRSFVLVVLDEAKEMLGKNCPICTIPIMINDETVTIKKRITIHKKCYLSFRAEEVKIGRQERSVRYILEHMEDKFDYDEEIYQKELAEKVAKGCPGGLSWPKPGDRLANITHSLRFDTSVR